MNSPTAKEIKAARTKLGMTKREAAETIACSLRAWEEWEAGRTPMHPAFWLAWVCKTQH
jgi:DNA-binding transcriptional regulator YiaG